MLHFLSLPLLCIKGKYVSQATLSPWLAQQKTGWWQERGQGMSPPFLLHMASPVWPSNLQLQLFQKLVPLSVILAVPGLAWEETGLWSSHMLPLPLGLRVVTVSWHCQYLDFCHCFFWLHSSPITCLTNSHIKFSPLEMPSVVSWRFCLLFQIYFISPPLSH